MNNREEILDIIAHTPCVAVSSKIAAEHILDNLISHGILFNEWISVKDRLPKEKGRYLTTNKRWDDKVGVFDLWFDDGFWFIDEDDDMFDYEVTHWQPLPEPPKED